MCKTLIVEDNASFREMIKEILHSHFPAMKIEEEPDGRELVSKMDAYHPNIVFMDIRLPGENGLVLTKKIKTIYPDVTVVILTSYDLPEYRQAALQNKAVSGVNYFFLPTTIIIPDSLLAREGISLPEAG